MMVMGKEKELGELFGLGQREIVLQVELVGEYIYKLKKEQLTIKREREIIFEMRHEPAISFVS